MQGRVAGRSSGSARRRRLSWTNVAARLDAPARCRRTRHEGLSSLLVVLLWCARRPRRSHGLHLVTLERHYAVHPRAPSRAESSRWSLWDPDGRHPAPAGSTTDRGHAARPSPGPARSPSSAWARCWVLRRRSCCWRSSAGGSPYAIRHCVRWLSEHGHLASPAPRPALPDPAERSPRSARPPISWEPSRTSRAEPHVAPDALSDDALCLAWRASFSALQRAGSPTQRLRIVDERRAYLDEIERRTAHGMAAWLASGARAAGDPSRFVLGDSAAGRAPIDWDDLLHDTDK